MKCLVVTPEKTVLDIEATSVVLPLVDGEYGIMPGHTPIVARLGAGELRVLGADDRQTVYYVEGGFVEVLDDTVALLSMHALPVEELDVDRAQQQLEEALNRPGHTADFAKLKAKMLFSRRARLRVAQKYAK